MVMLLACGPEEEINTINAQEGIISNLNSDGDIENWWDYNSDISIVKGSGNIKEGSGALEWSYHVKKEEWNLVARIRVNPILYMKNVEKKGISLWLKSDRIAPVLIQIPESDGSNYQYLNMSKPVGKEWKKFEIGFDEFKLDKDSSDENEKLDPKQIERIELVEVAGFFGGLEEGLRRVWIDDLRFIGELGRVSIAQRVLGPARVAVGATYGNGKFGLGVSLKSGMVTFPTANNIDPKTGTMEMWVKPLTDGVEKKVLFSCLEPPDILGRGGNRVVLYLKGNKLVFEADGKSLSSPYLTFKTGLFSHISLTWDGAGVELYFNGNKVAESTKMIGLGRLAKEMVVGNTMDGTSPVLAVIDELRVSAVKRSGEEISLLFMKPTVGEWDVDTLLFAHFDGSPLPEIDIRHQPFDKVGKISFDLNLPTPSVPLKKSGIQTLHFEVLKNSKVVVMGEKLLTIPMGDLSGLKKQVRLSLDIPSGGEYRLSLKLFYENDLINRGELVFSVPPVPKSVVPVPRRDKSGEWYQKVQVYGIVPIPAEKAKAFNITVNGIWGGSHTDDPILVAKDISPSIRVKYKTGSEYVSAMHASGLLTSGGMIGASGNKKMLERWPELKGAISKTAWGRDAVSWIKDAYIMSENNPLWYNLIVDFGKKSVDAGADVFMIDDIQEFQFPFHYGYDSYSIDGFKKYLRSNFTVTELVDMFAINDVDSLEIGQRNADTATLHYDKRVEKDPLIEVFARFHEQNNFNVKKRAIEAIRAYAKKKGKKIAIAANIYGLGSIRFDGYWSKGLIFSELVDFFAYESIYSVGGKKVLDMPLPRGKWVAWEKLSCAATKAPAVPLLAADSVKKLVKKKIGNFLYILTAEAYANGSAHMLYQAPAYGLGEQWKESAAAAGFILKNRQIYEAEQSVYSPVAVLYLSGEGMKTKLDTYLGISQALAESNIPFDVVFSGCGNYLKDTSTLQSLKKYKLIFIPSLLEITDRQREIIKKYVAEGGMAVIFDPGELNIREPVGDVVFGKGSFITMPNVVVKGREEDPGRAYNLTYDDMTRKAIENTVRSHVGNTVIIDASDRKVVAYPYYQPQDKRLVVHLINYDHDFSNDKIMEKKNIKVRIKKPSLYSGLGKAFMLSPDFTGRVPLKTILIDGYIEFVIPQLNVYTLVLLGF